MKRMIFLTVALTVGMLTVFSVPCLSQTGEAHLRWTPGVTDVEVSVLVKRTGGAAWNLGFSTLAFRYNKTALAFNTVSGTGRWDGATSSAYGPVVSAASLDSSTRSVEVEHLGNSGSGTDVPTLVALVGTVKFRVKDNTKPLDIQWDPLFSTVHTDAGVNITNNIVFIVDGTVGVAGEAAEVPQEFALQQNYPNPFNPTTTITVAVAEESRITVDVYNILGEKVATLLNDQLAPGYHQVRFDAGRVASGLYVYRMSVNGGQRSFSRKMMVLK